MAKKRAFRGYAFKQKFTRTEVDGVKFQSKREARRYVVLKARFDAGEIECLRLQPGFEISVNGVKITTYRADFSYVEGDTWVVEDVKSVRTPEYELKSRLMLAVYGISIREV